MVKLNLLSRQVDLVGYALAICFLSGCATGHCHGRKVAAVNHVYVFKYDGSKQCKKNSGIDIKTMQTTLKDIKVYSSENRSDGNMHMMLCGGNSGRINVYEIDADKLDDAKMLGFKEWTDDKGQ